MHSLIQHIRTQKLQQFNLSNYNRQDKITSIKKKIASLTLWCKNDISPSHKKL